jgi:hypothetical protein
VSETLQRPVPLCVGIHPQEVLKTIEVQDAIATSGLDIQCPTLSLLRRALNDKANCLFVPIVFWHFELLLQFKIPKAQLFGATGNALAIGLQP